MHTIVSHIANSTGELSDFTELIKISLNNVVPIAKKELGGNQIDVFFISAAAQAIPEYGIGGFSPGPNHIYISFDPESKKITKQGLDETLLHEMHHCMRWRNPGYGNTLGEAMVTEGLACLYEEQHSGDTPIFASINLEKEQLRKAKRELKSKKYNHSDWFFGSKDVDRWFGYTCGYELCKDYSTRNNKTASELVNVSASKVLEFYDRPFIS